MLVINRQAYNAPSQRSLDEWQFPLSLYVVLILHGIKHISSPSVASEVLCGIGSRTERGLFYPQTVPKAIWEAGWAVVTLSDAFATNTMKC